MDYRRSIASHTTNRQISTENTIMYPPFFEQNAFEEFILPTGPVQIPKAVVKFTKWTGQPITNTFGGKMIVEQDGHPMFAELAIATIFQQNSWDARWIETYGKSIPISIKNWIDAPYKDQVHFPFADKSLDYLLFDIARLNANSYSGCWDVVAKKDGQILFVESKRTKKDSIRGSQVNWLDASLRFGLTTDNFLVVQWDI